MAAESHIGETAELYAAGALDARERRAVESHAAQCVECLRRLGEAEETVLALEQENVIRPIPFGRAKTLAFERRGMPRWWLAVAAAIALLAGVTLARFLPQTAGNVATLAMIASHFNHAQFGGAASAPPAKVLYARDRSWYYVIVAGAHRYTVVGVYDARRYLLGTTSPRGETSELFVRLKRDFDRLELRDNQSLVETAAIR